MRRIIFTLLTVVSIYGGTRVSSEYNHNSRGRVAPSTIYRIMEHTIVTLSCFLSFQAICVNASPGKLCVI